MSFFDAQAMILIVILTVYQTHDFEALSGDHDKWRVFGESESKNIFALIMFLVWIMSFHSTNCNAYVFGVHASQ
jgi:hypothetical protein